MSEILFQCLIQVEKHSSKKNKKTIHFNRSTKRPFIGTDSKTKHLENVLNAALLREKLKAGLKTIECDISVAFVFHYPKAVYYTKQGKRSTRVIDLSNSLQGPEDALTKVGIIVDDRQICSLDGSRRGFINDTKYYLGIEIRAYNGEA